MDDLNPLRSRPSLLGMRLTNGPLDHVAISLGPGLTALYGQNGAGKTSILNGLRDAIFGRTEWMTQLIAEFDVGSEAYGWVLKHLRENPKVRKKLQYDAEDRAVLRHTVQQWFMTGGQYFSPDYDSDEIEDDLVEELASSRIVALVPKGSMEPTWDVWLCMPPKGSGNAACDQAISQLLENWRQEEERDTRVAAAESALDEELEQPAASLR